jgi:hypothetical protein
VSDLILSDFCSDCAAAVAVEMVMVISHCFQFYWLFYRIDSSPLYRRLHFHSSDDESVDSDESDEYSSDDETYPAVQWRKRAGKKKALETLRLKVIGVDVCVVMCVVMCVCVGVCVVACVVASVDVFVCRYVGIVVCWFVGVMW